MDLEDLQNEDVRVDADPHGADGYLKVLQPVGSGSMGDVHAARDLDLGRVVAIKVMKEQSSGRASLREAFVREAKVTAQLEHPNILPVYRLERTDKQGDADAPPAFSMKLVQGETLAEALDLVRRSAQDPRAMAIGARLDVFVSVCDAMAYAHHRGVVHRDLKPPNIMIGRHGEVYVLDWGIARLVRQAEYVPVPTEEDDDPDATRTRVGEFLGSPLYMSPEQALQQSADAKSDQYALGLILQEIVTLQPANPAKTWVNAVVAASTAKRAPMAGPRDLCAIVDRACQLDPAMRYGSVQEMVADVRRYQHGLEVSVLPDGPIARLGRWARHNQVPAMLMVGGILAAAALATMGSLASAITAQRESLVAQKATADRVSAVSRRSHHIDTILMQHEALLDGFAEQVQQQWDNTRTIVPPQPLFDRPAFRRVAGVPPEDYRPSKRYGMDVSFDHPLYLVPPDADPVQGKRDGQRLAPLRENMRRIFLRSKSEETALLPDAEADALLRGEGVPPVWIYVAVESGVILNYPGHPNLSDAFDPRARPWYKNTKDTYGPKWGEPHQGDSGYSALVPCNRAVYDSDGTFFGVVGLDVTLDDVIDLLDIDLKGVTRTFLVGPDGQVLVASTQKGLNHGAGLHDNKTIGSEPLPFPDARQAIIDGSEAGHVAVEDGLLVYDKMDALGWIYAVHLQP